MNKISLFATLFFLVGCMTSQPREFNPRMCNKSAAYEVGYNDALSIWGEMNSGFLNQCRDDLRAEAQSGYREGFFKGQEERRRREEMAAKQDDEEDDELKGKPVVVPMPGPSSGPQININIGGKSGGGSSSSSRAWFCEVTAFTRKFESFGSTQLEAKRAVAKACASAYHEMHCDEVKCQSNH